jgi:hypothetical protein
MTLQERRKELEKKLELKESTHYAKFKDTVNEGAYQDSYRVIKELYDELYSVCLELGDPIPKRL